MPGARSPLQGSRTPRQTVPPVARGPGADWKWYGKTGEVDYFYDIGSITPISVDIVSVWTKLVYEEEGVRRRMESAEKIPKEDETLTRRDVLEEVNCSERKIRDLYVINYSKMGNSLNLVPDYTLKQWEFIVPGSIGEILFKKVCR